MQDLGEEEDLCTAYEALGVRLPIFEAAWTGCLLHRSERPRRAISPASRIAESLYLWEQNYCPGELFRTYFQSSGGPDPNKRLREHSAFEHLAKHLAPIRQVLRHSDFQSQNIIVWDEQGT